MSQSTATLESDRITITTTSEATFAELENALFLRRRRALLIASALHGGMAKGFKIAASDIPTTEIHRLARLAAAREGKSLTDKEWNAACEESIEKHSKGIESCRLRANQWRNDAATHTKGAEFCEGRAQNWDRAIQKHEQDIEHIRSQMD